MSNRSIHVHLSLAILLSIGAPLCLSIGCQRAPRDPQTVVLLIESGPTSLDPRIGTDAQSEHIDELLFDGLVERTEDYQFRPALAERWEQPDPLTLVFHLRQNVHFHDGRILTARDVQWTIGSMQDGTILSPKANAYASVNRIETPSESIAVFHLKHADNSLLENLSTGAIGIVPAASGRNFWLHPIGTGPFRFVSQAIDQQVLIERNPASWRALPNVERVRFSIVPDANTRALELEKGSADAAVNAVAMDTLSVLAAHTNIAVEETSGTVLQYLGFNTQDPLLRDPRVRRAIAHAIDRRLIIETLLRGHAQPADSLLPADHWAWTNDVELNSFDPSQSEQLLDEAGFHRASDNMRFHLTFKTSTDESARLLASVLQQQLAHVGIALDLRSYEFATFYSDVVRGAFQIYTLRWVGGNEQPSIFSYAFSSASFPPKGANRGRYKNPALDALLNDADQSSNPGSYIGSDLGSGPGSDLYRRRKDYFQAQRILAHDMPAINLWYTNSIIVHNRRLVHVVPTHSGSFQFLRTAQIAP